MNDLQDLWVYLSASPLLHLTLTLSAFVIASFIYRKFGMHPLLNPVMLSIIAIVLILEFTQTSYSTYFEGLSLYIFYSALQQLR